MAKNIAIVYHSGFGHTAKLAEYIALGVSQVAEVEGYLLSVDNIDWDILAVCGCDSHGLPYLYGQCLRTV
jgi:NAD(P)H dehydrogenase (quinone)